MVTLPPSQARSRRPLRLARHAGAALGWLLLVLVALPVPVQATDDGRVLGIQPFLSPPALFERYAPLRDWLATELGVPIRIESARTRDVFHRRLSAERYDLVFTSPHVVPILAEETDYRPVAATRDRLAILIAVLPESNIHTVEDLANVRIAAPFQESLAAAFLSQTLSEIVWPEGSGPPNVRHHHHHSAAVTTFLRGEAEGLVLVTDGDLVDTQRRAATPSMSMSLGDGTLVRVISASPSFPGMTLLARQELLADAPDLTERLRALQDTPRGQQVLRSIRHRGFMAVEETDFRPFAQRAYQRKLPSLGNTDD